MNKRVYIILLLIVGYALPAVYSQNVKPKTQSAKSSKSIRPRSKPVAVKSTNSSRSNRTNKQWKTNSTLGMYSSWPSNTNKPSSKTINKPSDNSDNESDSETDDETPKAIEKKEKESFWSKFKLFRKQ